MPHRRLLQPIDLLAALAVLLVLAPILGVALRLYADVRSTAWRTEARTWSVLIVHDERGELTFIDAASAEANQPSSAGAIIYKLRLETRATPWFTGETSITRSYARQLVPPYSGHVYVEAIPWRERFTRFAAETWPGEHALLAALDEPDGVTRALHWPGLIANGAAAGLVLMATGMLAVALRRRWKRGAGVRR